MSVVTAAGLDAHNAVVKLLYEERLLADMIATGDFSEFAELERRKDRLLYDWSRDSGPIECGLAIGAFHVLVMDFQLAPARRVSAWRRDVVEFNRTMTDCEGALGRAPAQKRPLPLSLLPSEQ